MGHLVRTFVLAEALAERSRVVLACGGRIPDEIPPPRGVEIVALPALRIGAAGELVSDASGSGASAELLVRRRERLLALLDGVRPRIVVIELFPFGRKKLAPELLPFLEAARAPGHRARVVCSLRDLLVSARRDQQLHDDRACERANALFDAILVHADPRFARLEETFRPRLPLRVPVHYTGFVARQRRRGFRGRHVLVSAGGGRVGGPLLQTALAAQRALWPELRLPMRLVAGPFLPAPERAALRAACRTTPGAELLDAVPDLASEIARAGLSVSQCGYNTVLEVVQAGIPAVFVPFATPSEDEQRRRASRLGALGVGAVLAPEVLDAATLAEAIRGRLRTTTRAVDLALDGATRSAALLADWAAAPPRGAASA
jgi:predicted glycosyltransferase